MSSEIMNQVLGAIVKMDSALLDLLLDEDVDFSGVQRELFLSRLNKIFGVFRKAGDTELQFHTVNISRDDNQNSVNYEYRFSGIQTEDYFKLVFEEQGFSITSISQGFSAWEAEVEDDEFEGMEYYFCFFEDDKINFTGSADYYIVLQQAMAAYDEIKAQWSDTLNFEDLVLWRDKHVSLFETIREISPIGFKMRWDLFTYLFEDVNELSDYINNNISFLHEMYSRMQAIQTEEQLLDWLLSYEEAIGLIPLPLKYGVIHEYMFEAMCQNYLPLVGEAFEMGVSVFKFFCIYQPRILSKYSIYSPDEIADINEQEGSHAYTFLFSLRFHISQREEARKLGIEYALYVEEPDDYKN